MYIYVYIYIHIYLSIHLSIHLSIYPSIYMAWGARCAREGLVLKSCTGTHSGAGAGVDLEPRAELLLALQDRQNRIAWRPQAAL